jgi:hypothetical protein
MAVVGAIVLAAGGRANGQQAPQDLRGLVAGLGVTGRGVAMWLERLGASDSSQPAERLLALQLSGEPVLTRRGDASSVLVDAELDEILLRHGRSIVLLHNHPSSVGLSGPDLGQLAKPGVAAVVAIGHDGSVFAAAAGPNMRGDFLESEQYVRAKSEVAARLRAEGASGGLSAVVRDMHTSHLVSLAMAKARIIEYWYSLRGRNRESFDQARVALNRVMVGAAARLDGR